MFIDMLVLLAILSAAWKGYQTGLLMALFNTISLIIGLAAAVKFSAVVSPWLAQKFGVQQAYLPLLSFAVVMVGVVLVIRLVAAAVQKSLEAVKIGFINRIGGVALYLLLYLAILSIAVYYLHKTGMISDAAVAQSQTAGVLMPWGPAVLDCTGAIIPLFKNMFGELNSFFDELAAEAAPAS